MKPLLSTLTLLSAGTLFAGNYYVNNVSGKDSNDGSAPDKAFKSVKLAVGKAGAGDTIHLADTGNPTNSCRTSGCCGSDPTCPPGRRRRAFFRGRNAVPY